MEKYGKGANSAALFLSKIRYSWPMGFGGE